MTLTLLPTVPPVPETLPRKGARVWIEGKVPARVLEVQRRPDPDRPPGRVQVRVIALGGSTAVWLPWELCAECVP